MQQQSKILTNLGNDSHVRNFSENTFKGDTYNTYQNLIGEIEFTQPEPVFSQNMVSLRLARGGVVTSVAYPGAFIDPVTGNMHGTYEGPIPGQMVMVGFENGNRNSPFVVNRYPYQGRGNSLTAPKFDLPLTTAFYNPTDVIIGHYSGSFLSFNTGAPITTNGLPGSVKLNAMTDTLIKSGTNFLAEAIVSSEIKSPIVKITGRTSIQLNGSTNFAVKYNELKIAFDLFKSDYNSFMTNFNLHTHLVTSPGSPTGTAGVSVPPITAVPTTADMSGSQNLTVLM